MSGKTTTITDEAKPDPPAMGRPRKFNAEIAERICDRIAEGDTLRRICKDQEFPTRRTVQRWVHRGYASSLWLIRNKRWNEAP